MSNSEPGPPNFGFSYGDSTRAARPDRTTLLGLSPQGLVPNLHDVIIFNLMAGVLV
jgi:hypothetical protein